MDIWWSVIFLKFLSFSITLKHFESILLDYCFSRSAFSRHLHVIPILILGRGDFSSPGEVAERLFRSVGGKNKYQIRDKKFTIALRHLQSHSLHVQQWKRTAGACGQL